jgi:hypothetical protein
LIKKRRQVAPLFWVPTELEALQSFERLQSMDEVSVIVGGYRLLLPSEPIRVCDSAAEVDPVRSDLRGTERVERRLAAAYRSKAFHPVLTMAEASRRGWAAVAATMVRSKEESINYNELLSVGTILFPELTKVRSLAELALKVSQRPRRGSFLNPDYSASWEPQARSDRRTLSRHIQRLLDHLPSDAGLGADILRDPFKFMSRSAELLNHVLGNGRSPDAPALLATVHHTIVALSSPSACAHCFRHPLPGERWCALHSSSTFGDSFMCQFEIPGERKRVPVPWLCIQDFTELPGEVYQDFAFEPSAESLASGMAHVLDEMMYCSRVPRLLGLNPPQDISPVDLLLLLRTRIDPIHRSPSDWVKRVSEAERYLEQIESIPVLGPSPEHVNSTVERIAKLTELARNGERNKSALARAAGITRQAIDGWFKNGLAAELQALIAEKSPYEDA